MNVKYYGHSCFLIKTYDDVKLIIDPWISNPLSPIIDANDLKEKIDYILITHDHNDHTGDFESIADIHKATIIGVFEFVKDLPYQTIPCNVGGTIKLSDETSVYVTNALHSCSKGTPVGYIIESDFTIYHAGDTAVFSEIELYKEMFDIELALLPIGGTFTMNTKTVLKALELLEPKKFIPMHYNTFDAIKVSEEELRELEEKTKEMGIEFVKLMPGEELNL